MLFKIINEKLKTLTIWDFGALKITVIAFTLMMAKLVPEILTLDWWIYGLVFFVFYAYMLKRVWF